MDPITGKPMTSKDLVPLIFHKNDKGNCANSNHYDFSKGKFHCPVTYKEFTDFTHIVAIKTSGHVYAWEAIEEYLSIQYSNTNQIKYQNEKHEMFAIRYPIHKS